MRAAMAERIWQTIKRNKTLQYGVPMLLLIIGGSFGLREFTQIRYDAHKRHGKIDPALEEKIKKNKVSLESEYEKLKDAKLDDWKNIRGPRPWEDSKSLQDKQQ
ncbi:cytochrome c oxidase assembly protein COX16 homolog, mitochondrial isoform X1 [Rhinatrema bivittatum]|uniref:cytochrome c oxidase assembly protein COX16 homolog, mitochondrial isoform X1 n=1 Tax=Rhinatrema bivittatum TaxID=194408 RepID=UPI00112AB217|nr:cytochrome c oxidase assembly protein COX16 homolog, mitochondrial isoform X1 [Rhinatrema bivittatum]XP_029454624.1 cytochrome c oxidase assembly protein COX16 homolog, mitochondrial isoform X1 [Rhinatrema bivittatum]XP_029454625.1 cytochrome c oxidase assembly protein COX16 homolog, mitochondrial isoform X1 [Rhinatrema bivittatum]